MNKTELQRRSSKILEERSTKHLLEFGNLYQLFTTLGLEPVSIIHYTRPGSSIKRPTPNLLATQCHLNWPVVYPKVATKSLIQYQRPSLKIFEDLCCNSDFHHGAPGVHMGSRRLVSKQYYF